MNRRSPGSHTLCDQDIPQEIYPEKCMRAPSRLLRRITSFNHAGLIKKSISRQRFSHGGDGDKWSDFALVTMWELSGQLKLQPSSLRPAVFFLPYHWALHQLTMQDSVSSQATYIRWSRTRLRTQASREPRKSCSASEPASECSGPEPRTMPAHPETTVFSQNCASARAAMSTIP